MSFYNGNKDTFFGIYIVLFCNNLALGTSQATLKNNEFQTTNIPKSLSLTPTQSVPIEFPKNESQYNIIKNSTILANLTHLNESNTEVSDLKKGSSSIGTMPMKLQTSVESKLDHLAKMVFNENTFKSSKRQNVFPKDEAELIQIGNNEDTREAERNSLEHHNSHGRGVPMVQGQLAAICAGIFVVLAVLGYVGLLSWRRFLENRYGNREMLVNEEDMYDPNDLRHFSL